MQRNPDQNDQVSAVPDLGVPIPSGIPGDDISAAGAAENLPDLPERLRVAEAEVAELKDSWLRAKADADNVRKQAQSEIANAQRYAIFHFARDLLAVKDALEQTLAATAAGSPPEALTAGVELTLKQVEAAFDRAQLQEIDPAGAKFDPREHQAVQMVDGDAAPNTVVQVLQKGYRLNDRVLRPALVTVAKGPASSS